MPTDAQLRASAIRRGAIAARRQMLAFSKDQLDQLRASYERALTEIDQAILEAAGSSGTVRLAALASLRARVQARLEALQDRTAAQLNAALEVAAEYGTRAVQSHVNPQALVEAAQDAVRQVQNFVAADGLQLSDRVWRLGAAQREQIVRALESAIIQGQSAADAALALVQRGQPVPGATATKANAAQPAALRKGVKDLLTGDEAKLYRNAERLFRTEINRAHVEANVRSWREVDGIAGVRFKLSPLHPRPDICDMHSEVNRYGMGPGVYPLDRHPYPAHPETLSTLEPVFADEISADDKAGKETRIEWIKRQSPGIQQAVLGSPKKRAALVDGHLTEQSITTPWTTLRDRLRARGVDPDQLGASLRNPVSGYQPAAGTPVRTVGTVDAELKDVVNHAMNAIVQVHGVGALPEVPVIVNQLKDPSARAAEGYVLRGPSAPLNSIREIGISLQGKMREHTFVHEFGHFLDYTGIGPRGAFASVSDPIMAGVRSAISNSKATSTVRYFYGLNPNYAMYLLSWQEQWARAYAQWITLRSNDRLLRRQLDDILKMPGALPSQWQWQDFEPIALAIDNMMRAIGWVK